MRMIKKTAAVAAAIALAGGSMAAQAETARVAAPVSDESELGTGATQVLVLAGIAGLIAALVAITDDEPVSA